MTNRRLFLQQTAGAAVATSLATAALAAKARREPRKFQLKYAPHFGMFKEHAGPDPIAQLEFMAAQGFTGLEDNGLMGRPVELQERIGSTLSRLGMTMGVFVIDGGDNWKTSLSTGKPEFHEKFLATCRTALARAGSLLGAEVSVPGRERQAVRVADRRHDGDVQLEVQVRDHPPQHLDLLGVLAAEEGEVRMDDVEQLVDHCGDASKVSRPARPFELFTKSLD